MAVIIEAPIPMISVMAKPRTGPVPTRYRMPAVRAVLTFESMIALIACLNPSSTAVRTSLPCCSSSRIRSRSEEHTSELQSPCNLVCRLLLEKKTEQYHLPQSPQNPDLVSKSHSQCLCSP